MKDKKIRSSIRVRYALVFTAILVASLAAILVVNRLFLERFYNAQQVRAIDAVFVEMRVRLENDEDRDTLRGNLNGIAEQYNMSIVILEDNNGFLTVGAEREENFLLLRLYGYISGNIIDISDMDEDDLFDDDREEVPDLGNMDGYPVDEDLEGAPDENGEFPPADQMPAQNGMATVPRDIYMMRTEIFATRIADRDDYEIYSAYDDFSGNRYLEAWGELDVHHQFLIRVPMESLARSAAISNRFFLIVGVIVTIVGLIASFLFMRRITKPVVDLTAISEKMSEQDFSARYEGGYSGELDVLGTSMNTMADKLEGAIGELKTANEELKESLAYREKMDGMRNEFISAVSHDLKTPIALIRGYAEGLKDGLADDPESRDYYCEVISDEAGRMNRIVQKFIALNELEYGGTEPALETFDLAEVLRDLAASYAVTAETEGVDLACEAESVTVSADEFMVEEALNNYVSNAFHYVQDTGGGKRITLSTEDRGACVRVCVFNTGEGVAEEDLDRIWDKLYRSDRSRSREYGGNGIGLSIVKAIMDRHGRECGVYNTAEGPVFWFELAKEESDDRDH